MSANPKNTLQKSDKTPTNSLYNLPKTYKIIPLIATVTS
jgi:hypothetical protein